MADPENKKPNVVNLAEARRRQKTVRAGASSRVKDDGGPKAPATGAKRILLYLQFVLFLAIIGYMMTLCRGGA